MQAFLTLLLVLCLLGVVGVLGLGIANLVRGAGRDPRRQNALMRWRILLQAAAIAIFMLILALSRR